MNDLFMACDSGLISLLVLLDLSGESTFASTMTKTVYIRNSAFWL